MSWLDKYEEGGYLGTTNKGFDYNGAWGGQFQSGGSLPGSVGFTYARTQGIPSEGPYAKKTMPSAQNGMEMRYFQEGLDWRPKTISRNGGWLDGYDVPKAQNGETISDDEEELTYIIPESNLEEVVVEPSEFSKYRIAQKKAKSWEQFANERYLGNFERNMGQTINNLPAYRKQEYEDYIDKLAFDEYVKTHPSYKGEKRGAYIDRIQKLNEDNQAFERAYEANAQYNPSTDINLWRKGLMGLGSLVMSPDAINRLKKKSDYFSTKEKQDIEEHPVSSAFETTLGTFAPLEIPANMMYGKNNTALDALSGRGTDVPIEARILGDPLIVAAEAAPLISKGFSVAGKALGTEEGLLSNTWKLNPKAIKPENFNNPNSFYRQIDAPTFNEGVESGLIKGKQAINKTQGENIINLNKSFGDDAYYFKGKLYSPQRADYIYEVNKGEEFFKPRVNNKDYLKKGIPYTVENTNVRVSKTPIPLEEATIYKKHWLKGYKPLTIEESALAKLGTLRQTSIPGMKQGGVIKDDRGQWAHPGEITQIDSPYITMKGVSYPVLGVSNTGDVQMMYPEQEYEFDGDSVIEYPMARNGINNLDARPLVKLDQLTNFTNYNKPQPGSGWLSKYE